MKSFLNVQEFKQENYFVCKKQDSCSDRETVNDGQMLQILLAQDELFGS